jgi:hypothetical protein
MQVDCLIYGNSSEFPTEEMTTLSHGHTVTQYILSSEEQQQQENLNQSKL